MPAIITNQNWYDLNADRAYPIMDGSTLTDTAGTYVVPDDLIVDAKLTAAAALDPTQFFISAITALGTGVKVTIAVDGVADVATAIYPAGGSEDFTPVRIQALPGYQVAGILVFGPAAGIAAAGLANYTFTVAATRLLPTLITPGGVGVSSLVVQDSFGGQVVLTGAALLAAGSNATVTTSGQTVTVGMTTGVLVGDPCDVLDPGGLSRPAIRSINGVTPDGSGNIAITPVGCPSITAGTSALVLRDRCAEPCCGDAEMANVAQNINDLNKYLADLASRTAALEAGTRAVEAWLVQ